MAKELLDKREIVRRNSAPVRGAEVDAYLAASDLQGQQAVWSLSTAKPGNGVDQLRDGNLDTYWQVCARHSPPAMAVRRCREASALAQSDGPQPHLVNIQFHKKMKVAELQLYCESARHGVRMLRCSNSPRALSSV